MTKKKVKTPKKCFIFEPSGNFTRIVQLGVGGTGSLLSPMLARFIASRNFGENSYNVEYILVDFFSSKFSSILWGINKQFIDTVWKEYKGQVKDEFNECEWGKHHKELKTNFMNISDITLGRFSRITLFEVLRAKLSDEDIRVLCNIYLKDFDIDIDYEDLVTKSKSAKISEIINLLERRDAIDKLVEVIKKKWPQI